MSRAWFGKAGNAPDCQDAAHFGKYPLLVRDMMERVEAKDPVDGLVRQVNALSIEQDETMRGLISENGMSLREIRSHPQCRSGNVQADHFKAHLIQDSRAHPGPTPQSRTRIPG